MWQAKGLGYAINTPEELNFVKEIAATTGVILDPVYSGKAAYGLLKDMAENPKKWEGRKILFIHTGGLHYSEIGVGWMSANLFHERLQCSVLVPVLSNQNLQPKSAAMNDA